MVWKIFKSSPAGPPAPLTPEQKLRLKLREQFTGLRYEELTLLEGIARHYPEMLLNPDSITAVNLASIQRRLGVQEWEIVRHLPPNEIIIGCQEARKARDGSWY